MKSFRERMEGANNRVSVFGFYYTKYDRTTHSLPPVSAPLRSLPENIKPYNATRYDYEGWFSDFDIHRPIFLTGVFDNAVGLGRGETNIERITKTHRHFFNDLHRKVFTKSKRRLPRLVVIERGAGRYHNHMVIETPEHLSSDQFKAVLMSSWLRTKHGVNIHTVNGYDKEGLDEYCSKELGQENKTFSQVDEKNSYKN